MKVSRKNYSNQQNKKSITQDIARQTIKIDVIDEHVQVVQLNWD